MVVALSCLLFHTIFARASVCREVELPPASMQPVDFARDVLPIFENSCYGCHGPKRQRSGFRLDRRQAALRGGEIGAAIIPGKSAESPLIQYVAGVEDGMRMPPEGSRLSATQIGILRRWIDDGANWPDTFAGEISATATDWWSLRPIVRPVVPEMTPADQQWIRTPVDAFILTRLRQVELAPSPEANRRTLLRRLTFDLHGLPPTPEQLDEFLTDLAPNAYERLVDRLLSSEKYGERWARHWLDVAHYADSHGQDQDRPRPNAWPYRDYLIQSFNQDKPYAQFVSEQVAGDVLFPGDPAAIVATGFLAAGPWDESALRDIREDSIDRLIGQYLDRDDIVNTTMSTFIGLTVGCARCHDHKFDPVSQEDYYSLQAVFAGIDKAERSYDPDPAITKKREELRKQLEQVRGWQGKAEPTLLSVQSQQVVERFEKSHRADRIAWKALEPTEWHSKSGAVLKALIDRSILSLGKRPEKDTYVVTLETGLKDITGLRLELMTDETLPHQGPGRQDNGNMHLSEIRVQARERGQVGTTIPVSLRRAVADFDQAGWGIETALDGNPSTAWGIHPAIGRSHEGVIEFAQPIGFPSGTVFTIELDQLHGGGHLIGRFRLSATQSPLPLGDEVFPVPEKITELLAIARASRTDVQQAELARWLLERQTANELAQLPRESRVYCGTNRFMPDGSFKPVSIPRTIQVLARGDINRPGPTVGPGSVQAITELPARFSLADPKQEGERRAALARWLADPANPLTWRVVVNRVWHYHFGRGIVDTPNDFGKMGGAPSHPELLDWLAAEFRDSGGSLKNLHRLLVTSRVYRQTSEHRPAHAAKDADNRLLWRMNRQRLDAESLRDATLLASSQLNHRMYGPPVMHFVMKPGIHVTPEADYDKFDVETSAACRRSVYRFVFRTRPDPLLDVLDCPDASQSAPVRNASLSAFQALTLWNNKFTLSQAEHLAALAAAQSSDVAKQVETAVERVLCRKPTAEERTQWHAYANRHGLANFCRVLLNSSEFLFVD